MVPASTSRRKVETMKGSSPSTPRTTAPMIRMSLMIHSLPASVRPRMTRCIGCSPDRPLRSGPGLPGGPAAPPRDPPAGASPAAARPDRRARAGSTPGVETRLRARLLHDGALERGRLPRFEPEEQLPDRAHQVPLEREPAEHGGNREQRLEQERAQQETGRSDADEEAEEDPRGEEAQEPCAGRLRMAAAVGVPVAARMAVPGVAVTGMPRAPLRRR